MKLIRRENGKEVVYVQMQDIMYMSNEADVAIPATIFERIFSKKIVIVDDENRFDFVKFEEEHEVEFFKSIDYIIDFDKYKDLTDEQLEEETKKVGHKANKIAEKWNGMKPKERKKNLDLCIEFNNLNYMIMFLSEIYALNHGMSSMPFPEVN